MQQTSKYQFNLVDTTDDFSPAPLNQNMEKVEEELSGLSTALTQGLEEVEDSVTALEDSVDSQLAAVAANLGAAGKNARIAWGSYTGTNAYGAGSPNSLTCDFIPQVVFILGHSIGGSGNNVSAFLLRGADWVETIYQGGRDITVTWTSNGVSWYCPDDQSGQLNYTANRYPYLFLGYDE